MTVVDVLVAEFWESIMPAISKIIALLSHRNLEVRRAGVNALLKLAKQGNISSFLT